MKLKKSENMWRACQLLGHVSFLEIVTSVVVVFRRIKNVWRKKNLEKCAMYIGIEVITRFFCPAFLISAVLIKRHL